MHICNLIAAGWENNLGLAIGMKLVFKELGCKIGIGGVYTPMLVLLLIFTLLFF